MAQPLKPVYPGDNVFPGDLLLPSVDHVENIHCDESMELLAQVSAYGLHLYCKDCKQSHIVSFAELQRHFEACIK